MKKATKLLYSGSEWRTPEKLYEMLKFSEDIFAEDFNIPIYPNELKIVTQKQMRNAMTTGARPMTMYHWFEGKQAIAIERQWKEKKTKYYEVIQNLNPCEAYCVETNTATEMFLVISHACLGHNAVYRNNFMFKEYTEADSIVDHIRYARDLQLKCEEKYGFDKVEQILDAHPRLTKDAVQAALDFAAKAVKA